MNNGNILDRITAVSIILIVVLVPAWITMRSSSKPVTNAFEEQLAETGAWTNAQLRSLTLEQKVSQLFASYAFGHYTSVDDPAYRRLVDLVERFEVGSIVFFQGDPFTQALLANDLQKRASLPLLTSQDMEYGAGMRISRTTTFPSAMAIGATRNPEMAYAAGRITAREARALGTFQVYAPVADINNNAYNPVINTRSFGERADLVAEMVAAYAQGLQQGNVIATPKHFPGHGDTSVDSHNDLPILPFDYERLNAVELVPFRAATEAGAMSMMMGHLALPQIEPDSTLPSTLSPKIVSGLLREDLGFQGLIVSDAMRMTGLTKNYGIGEASVLALEAGVDILVLTDQEYLARNAVMEAIESGRLTEERIDASLRRLLQMKEWLGLHQNRTISPEETRRIVATREHKVVSDAIARASITLTRNEGGLIPLLDVPQNILSVTLSNTTDDLSKGDFFNDELMRIAQPTWFEKRLLDKRSTALDYQRVLNAANFADLIIVPTFLPVRSGSNSISLPVAQQQFLNSLLATRKPVILLSFGSPYLIAALQQDPEVYIAAYGESPASQKAAVQALFGEIEISGLLPVSIPGKSSFGDGIRIPQTKPRTGFPEEVGMRSAALNRIDSLLIAAIQDEAFPGAAVAVGRRNVLVKKSAFGHYTYDGKTAVSTESVYDLASLTKVIATTTAAMLLYERGQLNLENRVAEYLPAFEQNNKGEVTIRHLLTHTSGLIPFRPFHQQGYLTRDQVINEIMSEPLQTTPGSEMKYSDFNMILLALIIERISGQPFATFCEQQIFAPLGMSDTGFSRSNSSSNPSVVPTEFDNTFRKRLIQGHVHDETAFILGGTAGHAGLFSSVTDLSKFAFMMTNGGMFKGQPFLRAETIALFTSAVDKSNHSRALGWDTKSPEGYSSAGQFFSSESFGHTGFTGTSMWIDPETEAFVILLTNRVYPTRENSKHVPIRAELADIVYHALTGPPQAPIPRPISTDAE